MGILNTKWHLVRAFFKIWFSFVLRLFFSRRKYVFERFNIFYRTGPHIVADKCKHNFHHLSCVATSVLRMRLLHVISFSKKLRWLAQTNGNYFENAIVCSKCTLKTTSATQLYHNATDMLVFPFLRCLFPPFYCEKLDRFIFTDKLFATTTKYYCHSFDWQNNVINKTVKNCFVTIQSNWIFL